MEKDVMKIMNITEEDVHYYKKKVMFRYANSLAKKIKSEQVVDYDLYEYCFLELVVNSNDLESLLEMDLAVVEKIATQGSKRYFVGFPNYEDHDVVRAYNKVKSILENQIEFILANSDQNIQKNFMEKIETKSCELNEELTKQQTVLSKYETIEYSNELIEKKMTSYEYSRSDASLEYILEYRSEKMNFEIVYKKINALDELTKKIGKNYTDEQDISKKHI